MRKKATTLPLADCISSFVFGETGDMRDGTYARMRRAESESHVSKIPIDPSGVLADAGYVINR